MVLLSPGLLHRSIATVIVGFLFLSAESSSQTTSGKDSSSSARVMIEAIRAQNSISIDGALSEPEWQRPGAAHFTQRDPIEGAPPAERTEVWVAYDDAALYIAARLYDQHPDSISTRFGRRDADLNADQFYVGIDSYHDHRTGNYFTVYAGGTTTDGTLYNDSWDDNTWDGVWSAATAVDGNGWTVEMRIPYSQLRFPQQDQYTWGINFVRTIARMQERDEFVLVPKKESGWVSRFADLTGLHDINPPRKLEILPYVVSGAQYLQHNAADPFHTGKHFTQNMGADVKLGLGSNLTLNATINPDFGQVEVDPAIVNLTQFETYYDEKRPFFIEGSNFFDFGYGGANSNWGFNFGSPTFFYSRRIGRPPTGDVQQDGFTDIPDRTHIIGAAKLTGKVTEGWSVAALQACTAREYATTENAGVRYSDVVEPFTYYGVLRSQKEFNEGKQAVGLIGTAVLRDLNHGYLVDNFNRRAFTSGIEGWTNIDSGQTWVLTGWTAASRVEGTTDRISSLQQSSLHYYQRPDADYLHFDPNARSLSGYGGRVALNKQKGNTYLNAAIGIVSPGFETNDLGFMSRTDVINSHLVLGYTWFEPDGIFRHKGFNIAQFRNIDFGGVKTGEGYFLFYNAQLMNYWGGNGNFFYSPQVYDPRNTRGGPIMKNTASYGLSYYGYSDSRKPFVLQYGFSGSRSESGGYQMIFDPGIEIKPSSNVSITFSPEINHDVTIAQWVGAQEDPAAMATYGTRYIFGKLNLEELSASIRLDVAFTPKLTLQMFLQPLISVGTYTEFKELKQPGTYAFNQYGVDNGSTITKASSAFDLDPDGSGPRTDVTSVAAGDYIINPDPAHGAARYAISNPDFNYKSLRGNAVLRWEYFPGSTLYLVWTHQRTNEVDPGDFSFGRDVHNLLWNPPDNAFLIKVSYWWNP